MLLTFQSSQVPIDSNASSLGKSEEKVGEGKYSSHSLDEVAGMLQQTISAYEVKVFLPWIPGVWRPSYLIWVIAICGNCLIPEFYMAYVLEKPEIKSIKAGLSKWASTSKSH